MATQIPDPSETSACCSVCLTEPGCSVCGEPADLRYTCYTGFCVLCSACNERKVLFLHKCKGVYINPHPAEPVNQG